METPRPVSVEVTRFAAWRPAAGGTVVPAEGAVPPPSLGYGWRLRLSDGSYGPWRLAAFPEAALQSFVKGGNPPAPPL